MSNTYWQYFNLDELGEIVGGGTPSTKEDEFFNGDIPWITPKDLSNFSERYISKGDRSITSQALKSSSARIIPENSVLFTTRAPIGYIAISQVELCTNQGFKNFVPNQNLIQPLFSYYLLKYNVEQIRKLGIGSTFPEVSGGVFRKIKVRIPVDKYEQLKISNILGKIDDKIELNNKINKTLEEIAQAIFKNWFVDFEPFKDGEFVQSELGYIPSEWKVINLGEIIKKNKNKLESYVDWESKKLIDMANMPRFSISLNEFDIGSKLKTNIYLMKEFDILFGSIRSYFGKVGFAPFDGVRTGTIHSFLPQSMDKYSYVLLLVSNDKFIQYTNQVSIGTKMPIVSWDSFTNYRISIPEKTQIFSDFNSIIMPMLNTIKTNINTNNRLKDIRDMLIPKLMSGEIRVPLQDEA